MRQIFLFLLLSLTTQVLMSQHELTGHVIDESNGPLPGVTVILMSAEDSSMVAFGITNVNGDFRIEDVSEQNYLLQLSFVSYKTSVTQLNIDWANKSTELGDFKMEIHNEVLTEVTIEADRIPLGVRGDTITYNTDAFKTKPGATVEDLLKRLPGVEVARDGSIKAQGEDVQNVLVDGKEFFGKDPKIATQNLEAEAVDEVEVFDKASEMAEFTGIDDGQDEKTINLKLKEDYKSGGFGRVELAGGSEDRYLGKLNYNRFNTDLQASTIISGNNINKQAFSFNEYISMMGGISNAISNSGGIMNFGEMGGNRQPEGISDDLSAGLNFNYDFSKKFTLKSHYFYIRKNKNLTNDQNSTLFNNGLNYSSTSNTQQDNLGQNHRLNTKFLYKPTPLLQVQLKNNLLGVLADNASTGATSYLGEQSVSNNQSIYNHTSNQLGYDGDLQLRKKYKTKGRNWITNFKYKTANIDQEDDVLNEFNLNGQDALQNQLQQYTSHENDLVVDTRFTEPIAKRQYLSLSYNYNRNNETPEKLFFDRSQGNLLINEDLSADFEKSINRHRVKSSYRYNGNKFKSTVGIAHQWSDVQSRIVGNDAIIGNQASHLLPSLTTRYEFSSYQSVSANYNTSVNLPTLSQLTPIPNNTNPNLVIKGNAELIPEYQHRVNINFSSFDNFSLRNFYVFGSLISIKNKIINSVSVDENFLRTVSPINTDAYVRASINTSYGAPIRALKIKYNIRADVSASSYETLLNNDISGVNENSYNLRFTIENRKKKHFDVLGGIRYDISNRRYDLNSDFDQTFSNYALFLDASVTTDNGWTISTTYDRNSYSNEFFAGEETFNLWNATIRKSFKENKFAFTLSAYDILRQNIGLKRNGGINSLNEIRFNTLTRYATLGFSYKLGKSKKKTSMINFDG